AALSLVALTLASACGGSGGTSSPESGVPAPSDAPNARGNDPAARLFSRRAPVVQGNRGSFLQTPAGALAFNSPRPCSGRIVGVQTHRDMAPATFVLGDRKPSRCDAPGQKAVAAFRIVNGKIVLWHQLPSPAEPPV